MRQESAPDGRDIVKQFHLLTVSGFALLSASVAQAQDVQSNETTDPAAAAQGEEDVTEEILVTAERRSTNLQRTGVAASVLTGEDLVRKSVDNVEQLQFATPSLTVNQNGQG